MIVLFKQNYQIFRSAIFEGISEGLILSYDQIYLFLSI